MKPSKYLCTQCNLNEAVQILYGYPSPETLKAWHNKEVELGGCVVGGEIPNRKCIKCNHEWITNDSD